MTKVTRASTPRLRLRSLKRALGGAGRCAFLVQHDPDPDAIASALALRAALAFSRDDSRIISFGRVTRPENRRLLAELDEQVRHVSAGTVGRYAPIVMVDVQPPYFGHEIEGVAAVVDHHPIAGVYHVRYCDVRTTYGASATMAAEYLLASGPGERLTRPLATALLYGIITDTKSLSRSAGDDDLQMFAHLFPRADHAALRRIQHPSYAPIVLRRFGVALTRVTARDGLAYAHLGRLPEDQEHAVAQLAEFCLGIEGAAIAAVSGVFGNRLVVSTRALWPDAKLGERLRAAFGAYGSAGGHPVMAKAVVELARWREDHPYRDERALERGVLALLRKTLRRSRHRRVVRGALRV